jgi:hypothetical protein
VPGQLPSTLPSNRFFAFRGLVTTGESVTMLPPSEAWVGGSTHGVGEQVGRGFTGSGVSTDWPGDGPARRYPAKAMRKIRNPVFMSDSFGYFRHIPDGADEEENA